MDCKPATSEEEDVIIYSHLCHKSLAKLTSNLGIAHIQFQRLSTGPLICVPFSRLLLILYCKVHTSRNANHKTNTNVLPVSIPPGNSALYDAATNISAISDTNISFAVSLAQRFTCKRHLVCNCFNRPFQVYAYIILHKGCNIYSHSFWARCYLVFWL